MESVRIVGAGAIFIDDIVLPDGTTHMDTLGGGTLHAMMGAVLWDEKPGVSAFTGQGLPAHIPPFLAQHMDISGLISLDVPQARAWQIFEHDGTRRELHRVKDASAFVGGTSPAHLPQHYQHAQGYYLLQDFEGIRKWNDLPGFKLWEPNQLAMLSGHRDTVRDILQTCPLDAISPNLDEARAIYGNYDPAALIRMMFEDGARLVILRMGRDGSLIAARESGERQFITAIKVENVLDETGAGNTYNGAFLAGIVQGRNLRECGLMGTVAASFCVEQVGVIDPVKVNRADRDERYNLFMRV